MEVVERESQDTGKNERVKYLRKYRDKKVKKVSLEEGKLIKEMFLDKIIK